MMKSKKTREDFFSELFRSWLLLDTAYGKERKTLPKKGWRAGK